MEPEDVYFQQLTLSLSFLFLYVLIGFWIRHAFFGTTHSNGIDYLFPGLCSNEFVEYSDMELWRELIIIPSGSLQHLIPVVVVLALWCYNNFVNIHTITGKVSYNMRIYFKTNINLCYPL